MTEPTRFLMNLLQRAPKAPPNTEESTPNATPSKAPAPSDTPTVTPTTSRFTSHAATAVAASLATEGASVEYDVDTRLPGEAQQQLQVNPMTVLAYEATEHQLQQLVASPEYVATVVRSDKVRLLGVADAAKGLIKTLTAAVTDLALCPGPLHLLAVATADGAISVHRLTTADTSVNTEAVAALTVVGTASPRVAWHPAAPGVLFFTSSHVVHVAVLSQLAPHSPTTVDAAAMHLPAGVYSLPWGAVAIDALASNVAVAHDGSMVVTATADGRVVIFDLPPLRSVSTYLDDLQGPACGVRGTAVPFGEGGRAAVVAWVSRDVGRSQVLLASNELGCEVSLLHATPDEVAPLQSLRLTGPSAASLFNRVTVDPVASVVLLGSNKQCLYALHTSGMQSDMRFDYVTEFRMAFPILSMAAVGGEQEISLYCIQTNGVNRFVIDAALCTPPGSAAHAPVPPPPATPLGALLQDAAAATPGPPPVPPPTPAAEPVAALAPKAEAPGAVALKQLLSAVPSTTTTPLVAHRVVDDDDGAAAGALPLLAESPNTAPGPAPLVHLHPAGKATGSPAEEGDVEEGDVEYAVTGAEDHALRMVHRAASATPPPGAAVDRVGTPTDVMAAMRIEIANQMAAMERRQEATIARLLAAQAQAIDKERATLLATQRAETDRTIAALSSAINADLPARLADIMREQVTRALSSGGSVDRAARGQLDASFKTAFSKTLLPAFEAGVTNMLAQVHSVLAAGMAQHVASHTRATEALGRSIDAAVAKLLSASDALQRPAPAALQHSGSGSLPAAEDWKTRLHTLLAARQYEEAFREALADPEQAVWLVNALPSPSVLLGGDGAAPLSQLVLVALVKQLSVDLSKETATKLTWMREAAMAINNRDPSVAGHLQAVLGPVVTAVQALGNNVPGVSPSDVKVTMHVLRSVLHS